LFDPQELTGRATLASDAQGAEAFEEAFTNVEAPAAMGTLDAAGLIAGNMIGAGMLALPETSQVVGFLPTAASLGVIWAFGALSSAAIAAVAQDDTEGPAVESFAELAKARLGDGPSAGVGLVNVALNYMLLVAYTTQGAKLLADAAPELSAALGGSATAVLSCAFAGLTAVATLLDGKKMEMVTRVAMSMIFVSFACIVFEKGQHIDMSLLLAPGHLEELPCVLPIFVVSMVYQNCLPAVAQKMGPVTPVAPSPMPPAGFLASPLVRASVIGSLVPLVMYLAYDGCILGTPALDAVDGAVAVDEGSGAVAVDEGIAAAVASGVQNWQVWTFSMAALLTSCWGTVIGQVSEIRSMIPSAFRRLTDGTAAGGGAGDLAKEAGLIAACIAPPTVFATMYPDSFLDSLKSAAIFGDLSLYFALPVVLYMASKVKV